LFNLFVIVYFYRVIYLYPKILLIQEQLPAFRLESLVTAIEVLQNLVVKLYAFLKKIKRDYK